MVAFEPGERRAGEGRRGMWSVSESESESERGN